eukprot:422187-Alexandrium_andersonii.AAC.1
MAQDGNAANSSSQIVSASDAGAAEDFPSLGARQRDGSGKRQKLTVPRPKSVPRKRTDAEANAKTPLLIAGEELALADLGGNGDCGYRVLACVHAVNAGKYGLAYVQDKALGIEGAQ